MLEYPKTANLFARDPDTHVVIQTPKDEFAQIASWLVTEKIDGTNIRLVLDRSEGGVHTTVRGRSDPASLPPNFIQEALGDQLVLHLGMLDALQHIEPVHHEKFSMVVFGEGYGPGIQKGGGGYAKQKSLRIFDVVTVGGEGRKLWRTWDDIQGVADKLELQTVPVVSWFQRMNTNEVIRYVKSNTESVVAHTDRASEIPADASVPAGAFRQQEGVIARTDPYLFDFRGDRVLFKLKGKDMLLGPA